MHLRLAFLVVAAAILCACAGTPAPFVAMQWTEEVRLSNGEVVRIERGTIPGAIWYNDSGNPFYRVEQTMRFPDGVVWNSKLDLPEATSVIAAILERDAKSWILVTNTTLLGDQQRMGCPVPNFLYFRFLGNKWVRANATEVPDDMAFNLYILRWSGDPPSPKLDLIQKEQMRNAWYRENWKWTVTSRAWNSDPTRYMEKFAKHCDPHTPECAQPANAACNPDFLVTKP